VYVTIELHLRARLRADGAAAVPIKTWAILYLPFQECYGTFYIIAWGRKHDSQFVWYPDGNKRRLGVVGARPGPPDEDAEWKKVPIAEDDNHGMHYSSGWVREGRAPDIV
jgi:hypothetical protein